MLCEDKTTSHGFIWPGLIHISAHLVSVVVDIVQRHVHVLHVHPPKAQFNFPMSTIQRESEPDWNSSWKMSYILFIQIKFQSMFMQDDSGCSLRLISPINKAIKLHTSIVSLYPPPLLLNTFPLCSCEPPPPPQVPPVLADFSCLLQFISHHHESGLCKGFYGSVYCSG